MNVIPCQFGTCSAEIPVDPEDPDGALSDLSDHIATHGLSREEQFDYWIASQLAVRDPAIPS